MHLTLDLSGLDFQATLRFITAANQRPHQSIKRDKIEMN